MTRKHWMLLAVAFMAGLAARGVWPRGRTSAPDAPAAAAAVAEWTCSMHPQIRQPEKGRCPLCGMDLVPVGAAGADPGPRAIAMSADARERARIEIAEAVRGPAIETLRLAGILAYDDTRRRAVSLAAEAQIRKLYVNTPGLAVAAGAPLAELYSPEVFAAAQELVAVRGSTPAAANAARRKLALLGVSPDQIDAIARAERAPETFTVTSPIDGVILSVDVREGDRMMPGSRLIEVADSTVLWVQLDVYERHVAHVRTGQRLTVTLDALPGETFGATVTFVPPELDPMTRSLKVRAELPNPDGRLKPGLLARALLETPITDDAVLVPASAVLWTGARALVFVQRPDDPAIFEGRVVLLGPRAGDRYVVREGIAAGERVAARGALRIDSTLQLFGKPSMMSLPSEGEGASARPQSRCPVLGGEIDRTVFVDYHGLRIYFCCPGCDEDFLKDPDAFLSRLRAENIEPERAPAALQLHRHDHE